MPAVVFQTLLAGQLVDAGDQETKRRAVASTAAATSLPAAAAAGTSIAAAARSSSRPSASLVAPGRRRERDQPDREPRSREDRPCRCRRPRRGQGSRRSTATNWSGTTNAITISATWWLSVGPSQPSCRPLSSSVPPASARNPSGSGLASGRSMIRGARRAGLRAAPTRSRAPRAPAARPPSCGPRATRAGSPSRPRTSARRSAARCRGRPARPVRRASTRCRTRRPSGRGREGRAAGRAGPRACRRRARAWSRSGSSSAVLAVALGERLELLRRGGRTASASFSHDVDTRRRSSACACADRPGTRRARSRLGAVQQPEVVGEMHVSPPSGPSEAVLAADAWTVAVPELVHTDRATLNAAASRPDPSASSSARSRHALAVVGVRSQ